MQILATFTALPIGVYILVGSTYINTTFSSNVQFGLNGTTQNGNLQNILSTSSTNNGVLRITGVWIQTSAVDVYFSASGLYSFQNIAFTYLRIA